ncbi:hypothetical protein BD413DRAFT_1284 [Trametes elegans]|nr:hypothetical protein BD413DRAFT_1284 [Trametes elegans]
MPCKDVEIACEARAVRAATAKGAAGCTLDRAINIYWSRASVVGMREEKNERRGGGREEGHSGPRNELRACMHACEAGGGTGRVLGGANMGANPFYTMLRFRTRPRAACTSLDGGESGVRWLDPGREWLHGSVGGGEEGEGGCTAGIASHDDTLATRWRRTKWIVSLIYGSPYGWNLRREKVSIAMERVSGDMYERFGL